MISHPSLSILAKSATGLANSLASYVQSDHSIREGMIKSKNAGSDPTFSQSG